jgi:hypothetical protein
MFKCLLLALDDVSVHLLHENSTRDSVTRQEFDLFR